MLLILLAMFGAGALRVLGGVIETTLKGDFWGFEWKKALVSMFWGGAGALGGFLLAYQNGEGLPADSAAAFAFVSGLGVEYFRGNAVNILQQGLKVETVLDFVRLVLDKLFRRA